MQLVSYYSYLFLHWMRIVHGLSVLLTCSTCVKRTNLNHVVFDHRLEEYFRSAPFLLPQELCVLFSILLVHTKCSGYWRASKSVHNFPLCFNFFANNHCDYAGFTYFSCYSDAIKNITVGMLYARRSTYKSDQRPN